MSKLVKHPGRLPAWIVGVLALAAALPLMGQEPQASEKASTPATVHNLAECLHLAAEKQPALAAFRASLAAAQTQQKALDQLRFAVITNPDLPIRRKQSALGVEIADAVLHQAELDNAHAVTRLYFTVIYAREQRKVAEQVVDNFKFYRDTVREAIKKPKAPKEFT